MNFARLSPPVVAPYEASGRCPRPGAAPLRWCLVARESKWQLWLETETEPFLAWYLFPVSWRTAKRICQIREDNGVFDAYVKIKSLLWANRTCPTKLPDELLLKLT